MFQSHLHIRHIIYFSVVERRFGEALLRMILVLVAYPGEQKSEYWALEHQALASLIHDGKMV